MFKEKKVIVVMPAYNAAKTLEKTWHEGMAQEIVDQVILVDDRSQDETVAIASTLPDTTVHTHEKNMGYGATRRRATAYRWSPAAISSSWSIRITSTRRC